jgi:mRNA interferase MazF
MVKQGDIILLDFDPRIGSEQAGVRPALVVSNHRFHFFTGERALVCPITHTHKGYPAHVSLDERTKTRGVVLCDQIKSLDLQARGFKYLEKAPKDIVDEVLEIIGEFLE